MARCQGSLNWHAANLARCGQALPREVPHSAPECYGKAPEEGPEGYPGRLICTTEMGDRNSPEALTGSGYPTA